MGPPSSPPSSCRLVDILANGETVSELVVETITVLGSLAHGEGVLLQDKGSGCNDLETTYVCT